MIEVGELKNDGREYTINRTPVRITFYQSQSEKTEFMFIINHQDLFREFRLFNIGLNDYKRACGFIRLDLKLQSDGHDVTATYVKRNEDLEKIHANLKDAELEMQFLFMHLSIDSDLFMDLINHIISDYEIFNHD